MNTSKNIVVIIQFILVNLFLFGIFYSHNFFAYVFCTVVFIFAELIFLAIFNLIQNPANLKSKATLIQALMVIGFILALFITHEPSREGSFMWIPCTVIFIFAEAVFFAIRSLTCMPISLQAKLLIIGASVLILIPMAFLAWHAFSRVW